VEYIIYEDKPVSSPSKFETESKLQAVELWLDEMTGEFLHKASDDNSTFIVMEKGKGGHVSFYVEFSEEDDDFAANRSDGREWHNLTFGYDDDDSKKAEEKANYTFHLGVSCHGPNAGGKFRGAISVDSITLHNEEYDGPQEARQETMGQLLDLITRTLGFSRKDVIEELGKEANHGRENTCDHEGSPMVGKIDQS